jgi:pantoate--beta-alanine ligase
MNQEQRRLAHFGAQPEGTEALFRRTTLHHARCALFCEKSCEKRLSITVVQFVLTGPNSSVHVEKMQTLSTLVSLRQTIAAWRNAGERIALVPTMGNLHAGHLQLVERAQSVADRAVVSIFVNPMQFSSDDDDFVHYPRTLAADCEKLTNVDVVFAPSVEEVYPTGFEHEPRIEVPGLSHILCGKYRPDHFVGVATLVAKLFNMVQPDVALFGEKDYQQLLVIRRFVVALNFPVEIIGVPTVREADGLAMSSRNQYLSAQERELAPALYQALLQAKTEIEQGEGDFAALQARAHAYLEAEGWRPEYFEVCCVQDLQPATVDEREWVILAAAWLGGARLIDNVRVVAG